MGRRKRRSQNNQDIDLIQFGKVLLILIILVIFSYVIQGLTYLFELINQYKLALSAVAIFIIVGAVVLYRKKSLNTSYSQDESIIDVTPISVNQYDLSNENSPVQTQDVKRIQPITMETQRQEHTIESKAKSNIDNDFQKLIEFLESNRVSFIKRDNKKEKDYQDELWGQLRHEFTPAYQLDYEAQNGRHRLDILFNNSIGIELKVYYGNKDTRRQLLAQITEYSTAYPKMIGLVVNTTNENNEIIRQDIEKLLSKTRIEKDDFKIIIK